eukprot:gene11194-12368_t
MERFTRSTSIPQPTNESVKYRPKAGIGGKTSMKAGDEERIRIMNMVKAGALTIDSAVQEAEGLGVASVPQDDGASGGGVHHGEDDVINKDEIYNFGVHRFGKNNKSVKCVLQLDFPEHTLYFVQRGQRNKKYDFSSVKTAEIEDGTTRVILTMDDTAEFELDADSFKDRNRIIRLLNYIIEQQGYSEVAQYTSVQESYESGVIKEGILEKKGHNAAMLIWAKRFVRICAGEMMYFKVGEEGNNDNALNVIQLGHGAAFIKKVDSNGFVVITNKKEYSLRIPAGLNLPQNTVERSRDDWVIAVQEGSRPSRFSTMFSSRREEPKDTANVISKQEKFLKSAVGTLQEELEQLNTILTIVDAPFKASIQVRKVREIVKELDEQVKTGLLSWTMRSIAQHQHQQQFDQGGGAVGHTYNTLKFAHESEQSQFQNNASMLTHGFDFAASRTAIMNANRKERQVANESEVKGAASSQKIPGNNIPYGHHLNHSKSLDHSMQEGSVGKNVTVDAMYAKVNKERQGTGRKIDDVTEVKPIDDVNDDEPPPLPPRKLTYDKTEAQKLSADNEKQPNAAERKDQHKSSDSHGGDVQLSHRKESKGELAEKLKDSSTSSSSVHAESKPKPVATTKVPAPSLSASSASSVSSGPPPPPPPPPPPGVAGGIPPPPPPPGMMAKNLLLPQRKSVKPNKKLKPFFWMKVPDMVVANSFWVNAQERSDVFNYNLLEDLFQADDKKKVSPLSPAPSTHNKTLLESKKAQNLGIFLSGFKMKPEEIESKLMVFNEDEGLLLEQIVALKRFQPNTDEMELYRSFNGRADDLPLVDKFMLKLCDIPNLNRKLDILLTIMEVPSQCDDIMPSVIALLNACNHLQQSADFERLLEYILALGNYMNGGTTRGVAYGYKLSSLVKLAAVFSGDKEYNLLRFLVEQLFDEDPDAIRCYEQMSALLKPIDVSVKGLSAEIDVMMKDLKKAANNVENATKVIQNQHEKLFLEKALTFIDSYTVKIEQLSAECKQIQEIAVALLRKFGETPGCDFEAWLRSVSEFLQQLKQAVNSEEQRRKRRSRRAASLIEDDGTMKPVAALSPSAKGEMKLDKFQPVLAELTESRSSPRQDRKQKGHYDESISIKPKIPASTHSVDQQTPNVTSAQSGEEISSKSPAYPPRIPEHGSPVKSDNDYQKTHASQYKLTDVQVASAALHTKAYELKQAELMHRLSLEDINSSCNQQESTPNKAVSAAIASPIMPVKHGFLEKLSGGKKRSQKWDRRYFEVTTSGYLYYYKKVQGKPIGTIYLRGCPVQQDFDDPCVICIESEDRDWRLKAESATDAKAWVDTLMAFVRKT